MVRGEVVVCLLIVDYFFVVVLFVRFVEWRGLLDEFKES